MKAALSVLMTVVFFSTLQAQIEVGDKAPLIAVDSWVNNPNYDFNDYKGKVILLDFWFINCGPCIYSIPHINDLSKLYKNENIAFLSVTFEKAEAVAEFLRKKELLTNVGIDTTRQLIRSFDDFEHYPSAFLIDTQLVPGGKPSYFEVKESMEAMGENRPYQGYRTRLAVADWNNDNKLDLLVGNTYSPKKGVTSGNVVVFLRKN